MSQSETFQLFAVFFQAAPTCLCCVGEEKGRPDKKKKKTQQWLTFPFQNEALNSQLQNSQDTNYVQIILVELEKWTIKCLRFNKETGKCLY